MRRLLLMWGYGITPTGAAAGVSSMRWTMDPQIVVTVHGIATEGRWQEEIAPVLYPHFEPRSKKYRSFRYLGPLDLLFEPWALLAGAIVWALGIYVWPVWNGWRLLALLPVFVVAYLLAPLRLARTVEEFLDKADPELLSGRVHVVAHSLGSYITCTALRDEAWYLDRVVLAGCVVTPRFDWPTHVDLQPRKAYAVRNEVASRDVVAIAASFLRMGLPGFGRAGQCGFIPSSTVHTVPGPGITCDTGDRSKPDAARVHNFVSRTKGHSGVLKVRYVKNYWLPFFWGIDPGEYREFLDACFDLYKALRDCGSPETPTTGDLGDLGSAFMARRWGWAGGSIRDFLVKSGRPMTADAAKQIAFGIAEIVGDAQQALQAKVVKWRDEPAARRSYESAEYDEMIRPLDPRLAAVRAHAEFLVLHHQ